MSETFIGPRPPIGDHNYEIRCARCLSLAHLTQCSDCDGQPDSCLACGELVCQCPGSEERERCTTCGGRGEYHYCKRCWEHPELPVPEGREGVAFGVFEWHLKPEGSDR